MKDLLFLVHRIPYPPNKGDKIRSFHFLQELSRHYRVHLGAFIDDGEDWQYVDKLKKLCASTCFLELNPLKAKLASLQGFITGEALTVPFYRNNQMRQWVDQRLQQESIHNVLIFSSAMAQYIYRNQHVQMTVDFVDVDSDKWRQYAEKKPWPMSWVYKREAAYLLAFDKKIAREANASIFVSDREAQLFKQLSPENSEKITYVNNGVDSSMFASHHESGSPYKQDEKVIVFTGAMDYWANVDAVTWFVSQVFPLVRQTLHEAMFYIVGAKPTKAVLALGRQDNIFVTGTIPDIRPYIDHASVSVAPLRIARGVQNKVLEAMAMGLKVVATEQAIEGIEIDQKLDVSIVNTPEEFSQKVIQLLENEDNKARSDNNRHFVMDNFSWEKNVRKLIKLIG